MSGTAVLGPAPPAGDQTPTQLYSLSISDQLSGPRLIAVRPDAGELLLEGDTLHTAPQTFNLLFEGGVGIDEATINPDTIKLFRSGTDGTFGDGNEIEVDLGYVGLAEPGNADPDNLQRIVVRAASSASLNAKDASVAFPDDLYQIRIIGAGDNPLASQAGEAFNAGEDFELTFRLDRGAQVVSVVPQPVNRNTQELVFSGADGHYRLAFGGEETELLNVADTDVQILDALNALPNVQSGDIENVGARTFLFTGHFAGEQVDLLEVIERTGGNGTIEVVRRSNLSQASNQITVYFDDQVLEDAQVTDPAYYQLVNTNATDVDADDLTMLPESVTYDSVNNSAVLFFASDIPEGNYRLDVGTPQFDNSTAANATHVGLLTNDHEYAESGYLGDFNGESTNPADIDFYELDLRPGATLQVDVTAQLASLGLQVRLLDANEVQQDLDVAPIGGTASISFNSVAGGTFFVEVTSPSGDTGPYSIDLSVSGSPVNPDDDNTTTSDATDLGKLGAASLTVVGSIDPQTILLPPRPGSSDEPGHRQFVPDDDHAPGLGTDPVAPQAIEKIVYYFPDTMGTDPLGSPYTNLLTESEKNIARMVFELYGRVSGYEFIESTETTFGAAANPFGTQVTWIGKGDTRSLVPDDDPNGGTSWGGPGGVVMNGNIWDNSNRSFGDGFSRVLIHEIGHAIGLGHAYGIAATMGLNYITDPNAAVYPGDHDITHLQRFVPSNSTDVDLYRFEVSEPGRVKIETTAERLSTPSLLNTALNLYRQNDNGTVELVSQNDEYFGNDAFIGFDAEPGNYFVGVTSTGNTDYDPLVPDSGYGGFSDGGYELKLTFDAESVEGAIRDTNGTMFDGDADGRPGGVFSFWFQSSDQATTIYVDKVNDTTGLIDGSGTLADPYDNLGFALRQAGTRIVIPALPIDQTDYTFLHGQSFRVKDPLGVSTTFVFGTDPGEIDLTSDTTPSAVALKVEGAITLGALIAVATDNIVQLDQIDTLDLSGSETLLQTPNLVRVIGGGGLDQNLDTLEDNQAYEVGLDVTGLSLEDGAEVLVPQGVTLMLHAGALLKLRKANLDAGTSAATISRSQSSIQVLGTPEHSVFLRSFLDDSVGGDSDGVGVGPSSGDYGGIVFRADADLEDHGIFLNYVNHVDIKHAGGKVFVAAQESVYSPVHMIDARPTVSFNFITESDDSALSASPDSFEESFFDGNRERIGPDLNGNFLIGNTIDGLFIRVETELGSTIDKLTVAGRFDDIDIPHILTENLIIEGAAGGAELDPSGDLTSRMAGRLVIDPGSVVKFAESRIEVERGAAALIAEGNKNLPVVLTSLYDDRYGGSGNFDTNSTPDTLPEPGDWSGLYFGQMTSGSLDHSILVFGGGLSAIEGGDASFGAIEIHQANIRVANSLLQFNDDGADNSNRNGRGSNSGATIYVRGSQPIIVDNVIADNAGHAIDINANSLRAEISRDSGRATGSADRYFQFDTNYGPLVRLNRMENNGINGMVVRGEQMNTAGVWDDSDIVHVLEGEISITNLHTLGGLTLQSSNSESLIVKLSGNNAGITATGFPLDINDRVGGTLHVLGTVGHPVVMTHIGDDSVGAGYTPAGEVMFNTNNSATATTGASGGWRGLLFDEFSNDRNVAVLRELENPITLGADVNNTPVASEYLGVLAPDHVSSDENRRLGFQVNGFISPDDTEDVDVYSFTGTAGTPIWIDVDNTDTTLDAIVEVVSLTGVVLARSQRSGSPGAPNDVDANTLTQNTYLGGDHYTQNFRDPGLHYVLPGTEGQEGVYFIRVRSNPRTAVSVAEMSGESSGQYSLQVRLDQVQEFPGSTVRYADIRFASTGIDVRGLPAHSPLVGEAGELPGNNDAFANSQVLVNLLETDVAALSIGGELTAFTDIDWYRFDLNQTRSEGGGEGPNSIGLVFDLDYSDNAVRTDTTVAVYNQNQQLVFIGRESDIIDDQPSDPADPSTATTDLSRGSLGKKDAYIGPIHLDAGPGNQYSVAVMSNGSLPNALNGVFTGGNAANGLVRLEPVSSVERVVEDHIGSTGYVANPDPNKLPLPNQIDPTGNRLVDVTALDNHVTPYQLSDVALYVKSANALHTVDPFAGNDGNATRVANTADNIKDVVMRSDGRFFGYQSVAGADNQVGNLVQINPEDGSLFDVQSDGIVGRNPTLNLSDAALDTVATSDAAGALTFRRTGVGQYETLNAVHETDSLDPAVAKPNSKLYSNNTLRGDIQPAGVTYASLLLPITFADATPNIALVDVVSKIPGTDGSFTININEANIGNSTINADPANGVININLDNDPNPTAGGLVDLINGDAIARQMVVANVRVADGLTGPGQAADVDGTVAGTYNGILGFDGPAVPFLGLAGPLNGRVTGLAYADFNGNVLFGVTDAGELILIDDNTGAVTARADFGGLLAGDFEFQGLALGPQNVEGGTYRNTLFAITRGGTLHAIDPFQLVGNLSSAATLQNALRPIFDTNGDGVADSASLNTGQTNVEGLAFSPLDFNMWHVTNRREGDAGHGVNAAPDSSREAAAGGASLYFGIEAADGGPQHGILNPDIAEDLASNPLIAGTYNMPGGGYGSLETDTFDLAGSDYHDRPTLYFNYFLGSEASSAGFVSFRDSARVFISENGTDWELVTTNNSSLDHELAAFKSQFSDDGLNSATPSPENQQLRQELHDNTGQWRQARVDLSTYAGKSNLQLRFDFSTAGVMSETFSLGTDVDGAGGHSINDRFGELSDPFRSIRSTNNNHEGFYIDDIIIGYAERGEMVTGAVADSAIVQVAPNPVGFNNPAFGQYQLEVRRTEDQYIVFEDAAPYIDSGRVFDTNLRYVVEDVLNEADDAAADTTIVPGGIDADRNRERVQGVFIIDSNFITDSQIRGVNIQPGVTQAGGNVPHPGSVIQFPQLNAGNLVPGVVVQNNVIAGSSGIRFAGEADANPNRPVSFGRIINNTIVGDGRTGVGVSLVGRTSPTLINNLLTDLATGINGTGIQSVVKSNFFQDNNNNGTVGTDAILSAAGDPLFLDASNGNYILESGSLAVDSSQNTEQDRLNYLNFKTEIGLPASPIFAPDRDIYGQLRVDSNAGLGGGGSAIFKDRGATDRADTDAPYAVLLNPVDNDALGEDTDPTTTIVRVTDPLLENFTILLGDGPGPNSPFEGTGVDNQTVDDPNDPNISARAITISRNREFLEEGVDYNVGYNELTGVLLLTPLSTLWEPTGVYTIELDNTLIADRVGNRLRPNQTDGSTQFTVIMPQVEIDFGDADPSYATLIAEDGPRHAIIDGATPRLGEFVDGEFDALVVDQDDNAIVDVEGNPGEPDDGPFVVTGSGTSQVAVELTVLPSVGDTLSVTTESTTLVFELVLEGGSTTGYGRIPVVYPLGAIESEITELLAGRMQTEFAVQNFQGAVAYTPGSTELTLDALDDEDGVAVGLFDDGGAGQIVFITPGTDPSDALTEDIVGFLNPLDPWGTNVPVAVAGQGLLQAWVDFDQSGTFEADEQVIMDEPVSDADGGLNTLTIFTPEDAVAGRTWMRVRVSQDAGLSPTEFTIGGETEDYLIDVIPVAVPVPQDDFYEFNEDTTLTFPPADAITANDLLIPDESVSPVDVQYLIGVEPAFGTLDLVTTDFLETGNFTYTPNADFNGIDVFTYRIITQDSGLINGDVPNAYATVTLSVLPVNDIPDASAAAVTGEEDRALQITQSDLLASANPDNEDPSPFVIPAGATLTPRDEALMNEVNQTFVITEVQGNGAPVSATVPATSGNNLEISESAGGVEITVTDATVGDVFSIAYAGTTATFELLDLSSNEPRDGTVSVFVNQATDDADSVAAKVAAAIAGEFAGQSPAMNVVANANIVSATFLALDVDAVGTGSSFDANSTNLVNVIAEPTAGDSVTLNLDGNTVVFELVVEGDSPTGAGNIGVDLLPFEDPASTAAQASAADQLMRAMNVAFVQQGWGVAASIDPVVDANQIVIGESAVTAGRAFTTNRGQAIALFDHAGALIEMYYIGNTDLNRDNAPDLGGNANNLDEISFVATDDGISIDLVNNRFVYGQRKTAPLATAEITVLPQNDVPIADDDEIRMDVADLNPATDTDLTAWEQFFATGVVPEPTEDTPLTIPGAFLIQNDLRGRASANDENIDSSESDNNDLRIVVASVTANWNTNSLGGSVTLNPATGDVELVPPTDQFGDISFSYTIKDLGSNEFIDGTQSTQILESLPATVTVAIQPVNDVPVVHDRSLRFEETGDDVADVFTFTADQLINGDGVSETPNTPHFDTAILPFPFSEASQQLRVVEFTTLSGTVGVSDLPSSGDGEVTLPSDQGGQYTFTFENFVFVSGTFQASPNYNERTPFITPETFTYRVSDDGLASASALNQGYQDFDQPDQVSLIDQQGTVSITVAETNDAPGFDIPNLTLDILERDDELGTVVVGFAENILPGPVTAIDETTHQNVSFSLALDSSNPSDLIQSATLSPTGDLTVITFPDAVGQATMIVTATDAAKDPNEPFVARTTVEEIVINVRPVNDAPRLKNVLPDSDLNVSSIGPYGADEAWSVSSDPQSRGEITYTLREDNTQSGGAMEDYIIPVTSTAGVGYQQLGLFDVFTVGPENELVDIFPAGVPFDTASEQRLELIEFGSPSVLDSSVVLTDRGGVLTPVVDQITGLITALQYEPPLDFNESFGGLDTFLYTVQDNKASGGETYDLLTGDLLEDRLTRTNRVFLRLNPVNDRPVFTPETEEVVVLEDSAEFTRPNYAINVLGGPLLTAFDEHSQGLTFTVDLTGQPAFYSDPALTVNDFFSIAPSIDATTGVLNFKPAADVFGAFDFEVQLVDDGLDDVNRGDLNSSDPFQITIDIRPVNDPPTDPTPVDLNREIVEDSTTEWDAAELLAPFVAGPDNEDAPTVGGEQTLELAPTAFPTDSKNGGIVHYVEENGEIKLRYTPRVDFNGVDEFVYTVIDDGQSVALDGTVYTERRVATKTVTVNVLPVNDKPRFSGAFDQQNLENDGVVSVPDWATNVMPAAETASDEIVQDLLFVFDPVSGPTGIFETLPHAVIDRVNMSANLNYELKDDVSGVVVFDVTLVDDGPMDLGIMDEWVSDPPRRLVIAVEGVNNPPSFDLDISSISIAEDSGPYSQVVMSSISPGPADESGQIVSFDIADLTADQAAIFAAQPIINSDGVLQFTTAVHQNTVQSGPVVLTVTARDSEGGVGQPVEITISVSEVNDAPVATDDTLADTDEDSQVMIPQALLLSNDFDPDLLTNDNESLNVVLGTHLSAFGATVELDAATGDIIYDPADSFAIQALQPNESLVDSFTYFAEDAGGLLSALATVSLRVSGINDAPTVVNDQLDFNESGLTVINVLGNDRDVDGTIRESTVEFGLVPAFGTVSVNAQGVVTYRAFGELPSNDTFTYSVEDNLGARSNEALVTISSNKPPIAEDDVAVTYISESVLISILDNDSDLDGSINEQSVRIQDTPSNGSAVIQSDGQVAYSPASGFSGTDTFQYVVSDDSGRESNLATVTVTVLASRLQNSANQYDVNGDGLVTALDPLRIINYLEAFNVASIPVPPTAVGPDYLDVNGDGVISVNDALLVMNELTRIPNGTGEEVPQLLPLSEEQSKVSEIDRDVWGAETNDLVPAEIAKLSNCVPRAREDVIDLLAAEKESESDEEILKAVDEVLTDLI